MYIPYVPNWFLNLVFVLAIIGAITVFTGIIAGIVWLVNHVTFV